MLDPRLRGDDELISGSDYLPVGMMDKLALQCRIQGVSAGQTGLRQNMALHCCPYFRPPKLSFQRQVRDIEGIELSLIHISEPTRPY